MSCHLLISLFGCFVLNSWNKSLCARTRLILIILPRCHQFFLIASWVSARNACKYWPLHLLTWSLLKVILSLLVTSEACLAVAHCETKQYAPSASQHPAALITTRWILLRLIVTFAAWRLFNFSRKWSLLVLIRYRGLIATFRLLSFSCSAPFTVLIYLLLLLKIRQEVVRTYHWRYRVLPSTECFLPLLRTALLPYLSVPVHAFRSRSFFHFLQCKAASQVDNYLSVRFEDLPFPTLRSFAQGLCCLALEDDFAMWRN